MVLARRSLDAWLNSGFLNCSSGARSEYLGMRRFRAAGMNGVWSGAGAPAAAVSPAPVASGVVGASGLPGSSVWVMVASGQWGGAIWSNHSLGVWLDHSKYYWIMRTHQLVLQWIETQLSSKELTIGGRLPPERMLAEQLEVSRTSVREAIRILEAMGVVRAGVGSGPDAGTVVTAQPATALGSALRLHVATSHLPVADIVETRVLLESWAVGRARTDSPALVEAAALLDQMDAAREAEEFLGLDVRFHLALAEAAGNSVVSAMMESLREAIQGYAGRLTANLPDWDATSARLRAEHREILAAINGTDGARAARLVAAHIEGYYKEAGLAG